MNRIVSVRGTELAVVDEGDGPPFVWGHGLLGSIEQETATGIFGWKGTADVARLIRYDARGHGESSAASSPNELRWPELALDLWALVEELGVDRPVLGGTSMGCGTVLHAAVACPDDVGALVLALPPTGWQSRRRQQIAYRITAPVAGLVGPGFLSFVARFAPKSDLMAGELAQVSDAMTEHVGRNSRRNAVLALEGAARSDLPSPDEIARLEIPVLILSWAGDPTHPRSTAERLDRLLAQSEWHHATVEEDVLAWPEMVTEFVGRNTVVDRAP